MIQLSSPGRMWLAAITAGILAVAIGLAGASAAVIESTTFEQTVSGGTVPLPGGGALFFFPWHGPRSTFTVSLLDALPTGTPPPRTQLIYEIRATLSGEPVTSFSSLVTLQGPSGTQSELFLFDERTGELQSQGTCFRGGCNISQPGIMVLAAVPPPDELADSNPHEHGHADALHDADTFEDPDRHPNLFGDAGGDAAPVGLPAFHGADQVGWLVTRARRRSHAQRRR